MKPKKNFKFPSKFFLLLLLLTLCFLAGCSNFNEIQDSEKEYWNIVAWNENQVLMTSNDIKNFNKKVLEHNETLIDFYNLPEHIKKNKDARFSVVVAKSNLRTKPTNQPYFEDEDDTHFDNNQCKELEVGEPVIFIKSHDDWSLIETYNTRGWVENKNIAFFISNKDFFKYLERENFVVVTSKKIKVKNQILDMGVKLGLIKEGEDFVIVRLPYKNGDGVVAFKKAKIKKSKINIGYLPYTKMNLFNQATKYVKSDYGWGGLYGGVDCSGLLVNIFKTFGFNFPRNSSTQQNMIGNAILIKDGNELASVLNDDMAGSLLYFPGHIMLYLGRRNGKDYILHSLAVYLEDGDRNQIMKVMISDTDIIRKTGNPFKDEIRSVTKIEKVK